MRTGLGATLAIAAMLATLAGACGDADGDSTGGTTVRERTVAASPSGRPVVLDASLRADDLPGLELGDIDSYFSPATAALDGVVEGDSGAGWLAASGIEAEHSWPFAVRLAGREVHGRGWLIQTRADIGEARILHLMRSIASDDLRASAPFELQGATTTTRLLRATLPSGRERLVACEVALRTLACASLEPEAGGAEAAAARTALAALVDRLRAHLRDAPVREPNALELAILPREGDTGGEIVAGVWEVIENADHQSLLNGDHLVDLRGSGLDRRAVLDVAVRRGLAGALVFIDVSVHRREAGARAAYRQWSEIVRRNGNPVPAQDGIGDERAVSGYRHPGSAATLVFRRGRAIVYLRAAHAVSLPGSVLLGELARAIDARLVDLAPTDQDVAI